MKKAFKRILSVAIGLCIALMGMFVMPTITASAVEYQGIESAEFGEGQYLITTTYSGATYYLPAATTSSAPTAKSFTNVNDIPEDNLWTVTSTGTDNIYYIKNSEGKYLYGTNDNNGVRVGTTQDSWKYDVTNKSLQGQKNKRYLGVYNKQDWRSYTSATADNYKGSGQNLKFYKVKELDNTTAAAQEAVNGVQSYMRLAYNYQVTTQTIEIAGGSTDTLNRTFTGIAQGTTYGNWSGKKDSSNAVYAGNSAGDKDTIQMRSSNSNSGIVTTTSGGKATKIVVNWHTGTTSGRTLDIYGKNTAYTDATDLYNTSKQGTKLGSIVYGTSTELIIKGDYEYIGMRSASGAMYLSEISVDWNGGADASAGSETVTTLTNSSFMIQCGVDASLLSIANADEAGICVTAGGKTRWYHEGDSNSWKVDGDKVYIVINLGDIGANNERLTTEFTVAAYVKVGENTCVAEDKAKKHSVASMVQEYYEDTEITEVEHLYNYLLSKSLITEGN